MSRILTPSEKNRIIDSILDKPRELPVWWNDGTYVDRDLAVEKWERLEQKGKD